jgi:hypothetical protein
MNRLAFIDVKIKEQQLLDKKLNELGDNFADPVWRENLDLVISNIVTVQSEFDEHIYGVCEVIKRIDSFVTSQNNNTISSTVPQGNNTQEYIHNKYPVVDKFGNPYKIPQYQEDIDKIEVKIKKLENDIKDLKGDAAKTSSVEAQGKIKTDENTIKLLRETVEKDKNQIDILSKPTDASQPAVTNPPAARVNDSEDDEDDSDDGEPQMIQKKEKKESVLDQLKELQGAIDNEKNELHELNKQLNGEEDDDDDEDEDRVGGLEGKSEDNEWN